MKNLKFYVGNLEVQCAGEAECAMICYLPGYKPAEASELRAVAGHFGICMVVVNGMDWDGDLSPWVAKGVPAGTPDFRGGATGFLHTLTEKIVPQAEQALGCRPSVRVLAGISMSGLFALWQWMVCDLFRDVISLSGSFWYEGFVSWLKEQTISKSKDSRVYISLGREEPKSRNKVFATVGVCTAQVVDYLKAEGVDTEFREEEGSHYVDYFPRLMHGLEFICQKADGRILSSQA